MQTIVNLGTGGADLNGQNGSTTSADSNDALFLDWPGDNAGNYVYLPGVSGNYLSVPDEAALDITGDIDIRVQVAMDDYTPSSFMQLVSKWESGQLSYTFGIRSGGSLEFILSADGSATSGAIASVVLSLTDGEPYWLRCTWRQSDGRTQFFTSSDGATWSQVGTDITNSVASINAGSSLVCIGQLATTGQRPAAGATYRAQVLDGINGTTVLDVDTSVITSGSATSFTALTGQTVTINRSTSGRKSVAVVSPVWLLGTDDEMRVSDNAALDFSSTDSFTVIAVVRQWSTPIAAARYIAKTGTLLGYEIGTNGTALTTFAQIGDGTTVAQRIGTQNISAGGLSIFGAIVDRSSETLRTFINAVLGSTTSTASIGDLSNTNFLRIGRNGVTGAAEDFELVAVSLYRRVLSQDEVAKITDYYQARLS